VSNGLAVVPKIRQLQCVAVCCSVLQCVAMQYVVWDGCLAGKETLTTCCSMLQCVAVCCSVYDVLQCVAVRGSVLQCF